MNTPAHLIMGAAVFGRPGDARRTWAAVAGGFAPDLSLYAMAGWCILVAGIPAERVFRELYYSDAWQQVFAIDNSLILWGIALALAIRARSGRAIAFTGAAMLHLAFDFPLHNDDARMHFWPVTDWKFLSPVSYWDGARGGDMVGMAEAALVAALTVLLLIRFRNAWARAGFLAMAAAQIAPFFIWRLVF